METPDHTSENLRGMRSAAEKVAETLAGNGYSACFVGGCVRDMLWGRQAHDFDLVTNAPPAEICRIFPGAETVGAAFGVTLVKQNGFAFEVAAAREERSYLDGRHPESVRYTQDFSIDVLRRDFTVNALLYDPVKKQLLDYVGGQADLERGIIRTVGDPERRFAEDALRMLRAVRFAARYGFVIEEKTQNAIRSNAAKMKLLSAERIREELSSMLTGPRPRLAVELLDQCGLLAEVLPGVAALKGVSQPPEFHPEGDVFTHTMVMLDHMSYPSLELAWSILLHDIAKPRCRSVDPDGRIRFFGHEEAGEGMSIEIMQGLRFSNDAVKTISHAVRNHMRFASVCRMKDSTLRRLVNEEHFALELELHRIDCISCHGKMDGFLFLLDKLRFPGWNRKLPAPLVTGADLIRAGLTPSPRFKEILNAFFERQLSGEFSLRSDALDALNCYLKER